MDDKPEEVSGNTGLNAKTKYMKEMEKLEKVEQMNFTRMNMTKAQKKYHRKMMQEGEQDKMDFIDELGDINKILDSRGNNH